MRRDYYSPLKVFHHRNCVDALARGERPKLVHVQIMPTNRCNQNCSFCAYRSHGYSSSEDFRAVDEIPLDKLTEIVSDCKRLGVRAIEITGGGEPTVHKDFPTLCRHIDGEGLDYAVVTNGAALSPETVDALTGARWVRFSLDAGRAETYAAIRRSKPETFDRVRGTIYQLASRTKNKDPVIGVGFVVTRDNWTEVLQAAENAREDGVDNFRISAVFQNEGVAYFEPFYNRARELCAEAKKLQNGSFTVFNLFGDRVDDLAQRSPDQSFCGIQHLATLVCADQNVYRCCVLAYNQRGFLGSLKGQTFYDLWLSQNIGDLLRDFDARRCPRCMFNNKNRTIAYAINPNPPHANFL